MSLTPGEKEGENKCGKEALGPINVKARKSRGTKVQRQMLHAAVARHMLSREHSLVFLHWKTAHGWPRSEETHG